MNFKIINIIYFIIAIFLLASNMSAQVVYTDPEPNINIHHTSWIQNVLYPFNINNDTIGDLTFSLNVNYGLFNCGITPQNNTAVVCIGPYPDTLNLNDTIGPNSNWSVPSYAMAKCTNFSPSGGIWGNVSNKFVGIRIILGTDTLYGWVRLDVSCSDITIEDYAIDTIPSQPIVAGACIPSMVEHLTISDISNNKNGSDLRVSFERAIDETKVNEYRIIVVKDAEASFFNLDSAELVLPGNYYPFIPDGMNFSDTLHSNSRDKDGNLLMEFVPYKAFVLTIADTALGQNVLSYPSNVLTLTSPAIAATNVLVADTFLGNNIYTVKVSFNNIPDESIISEYRIIFVKTSAAGTFNKDSASSIPPSGYYAITPTGSNIQINLSSDTLHDYTSNIIAHLMSYKVFVLSVADGIIANVNTLSAPSDTFTLSQSASAAINIFAEDIANSGNASDMRISFNKIPDETNISGYRIIGVKLAVCDSFNISQANVVLAANYIPVSCTGSNINVQLPVSARDKDGNPITAEVPYRFFVLSVADNIHTDNNTLSKASNIVTLATPDYFKAGQNTGVGVTYHDIVPDAVLSTSGSYVLDLNNDGVNDFEFNYSFNSSPSFQQESCSIETLGNNAISVVGSGNYYPDTLGYVHMINKDLYWKNGASHFLWYYNQYMPPVHEYSGIWWDVGEKYLGLRVTTPVDTIYGWIRLNFSSQIVIKDYARYYRTTANISSSDIKSGVSIYPNPSTDNLTIESTQSAIIEITNIQGQLLKTISANTGKTNIDVSEFPGGVYFIKVIPTAVGTNKKIEVEKFVKE